MPAAVYKAGQVKKDMQLISHAVSHVCSMTRIELDSRKGHSLQREATQQFLAGHKTQKDLIDALYMSVLKEKLDETKMAERKRKARLLTRLSKRKAAE